MVTELGASVWWYDLRGVNAYLADDDGTVTLIDAGNPWDRRRILTGLSECGYGVEALDRILITHYDVDHVGSLRRFSGLDATVYVGEADAPYLTGERRPNWHNHKGALQVATQPFTTVSDLDVERVSDGDEIGSFTAIDTPGHTPGHVAYVSESLETAVLGDLVRESSGRLEPSPWAMSYDVEQVHESIRRFVERAPPFEIAAMGHGLPFERRGDERMADLAGRL